MNFLLSLFTGRTSARDWRPEVRSTLVISSNFPSRILPEETVFFFRFTYPALPYDVIYMDRWEEKLYTSRGEDYAMLVVAHSLLFSFFSWSLTAGCWSAHKAPHTYMLFLPAPPGPCCQHKMLEEKFGASFSAWFFFFFFGSLWI